RQLLFPDGGSGRTALRQCGTQRRPEAACHRSRRADSGRSRRRRGSGTRRQAIPPDEQWNLPHYSTDDRQAVRVSALKVLAAASEMFPLVKTGGLADVVGALPRALGPHGIAVTTLIPGYPAVLSALEGRTVLRQFDGLFGGAATLLASQAS